VLDLLHLCQLVGLQPACVCVRVCVRKWRWRSSSSSSSSSRGWLSGDGTERTHTGEHAVRLHTHA
jgi:hypothetical protein